MSTTDFPAAAWVPDAVQESVPATEAESAGAFTAWVEVSAHPGSSIRLIRNTQKRPGKPSFRAPSFYGWWWDQMAVRGTYA
jgi:hypothetical protein